MSQVRELLEICREYITALRLKSANSIAVGVRQLELSALFTHCKLQPSHMALALNLAMTQSYKGGNFIHAAAFARRMLELPDLSTYSKSDMHLKAQTVLQKSEQNARNEHKLNYDERNPFEIDCENLVPLFHGSHTVKCSFCGSVYCASAKGTLCKTCCISVVGVETIGLITQTQVKR